MPRIYSMARTRTSPANPHQHGRNAGGTPSNSGASGKVKTRPIKPPTPRQSRHHRVMPAAAHRAQTWPLRARSGCFHAIIAPIPPSIET
jgi:hypothetical protein